MSCRVLQVTVGSSSRFLLLLMLALAWIPDNNSKVAALFGGGGDKKKTATKYLYRSNGDNFNNIAGTPAIMDYYTPEGQEENFHPDFLYSSTYPHHRVVEFYSHLCPHCRNFAPKYIDFAKQFQAQYGSADGEVEFYAVSCFLHRKICKQESITGYPTVKIYKANTNQGQLFSYWKLTTKALLNKLGTSLQQTHLRHKNNGALPTQSQQQAQQLESAAAKLKPQPPPPKAPLSPPPKPSPPAFVARTPTEVFNDAYLSFYTCMKTSVFTTANTLPGDKSDALQDYLKLLYKVIPQHNTQWNTLIYELLESLLGLGQATRMTGYVNDETWQNILNQHHPLSIPQPHPDDPNAADVDFSTYYSPACQAHQSPYTCGLWTLLHMLTVGVVEYNTKIASENIPNKKETIINPHSVTKSIRNFVQYFLLCEVCTHHFLQEYDSCSYDRCKRFLPYQQENNAEVSLEYWKQLPLWLLETHNGVNIRLYRERMAAAAAAGSAAGSKSSVLGPILLPAEKQGVMWPPIKDCVDCWLTRTGDFSSKSYDFNSMYNHLRMTYWPDSSSVVRDEEGLVRLHSKEIASTTSSISLAEHNRINGIGIGSSSSGSNIANNLDTTTISGGGGMGSGSTTTAAGTNSGGFIDNSNNNNQNLLDPSSVATTTTTTTSPGTITLAEHNRMNGIGSGSSSSNTIANLDKMSGVGGNLDPNQQQQQYKTPIAQVMGSESVAVMTAATSSSSSSSTSSTLNKNTISTSATAATATATTVNPANPADYTNSNKDIIDSETAAFNSKSMLSSSITKTKLGNQTRNSTTTTPAEEEQQQPTVVEENNSEENSSNNPLSSNLKVVSREVQYSMIIILLMVIVIWNKRRILLLFRSKVATRMQ